MSEHARRNTTYQRLRAPARQGAYTVGQLMALGVSGVVSLALAAMLIRLGAPIGLSLTGGVLAAGAAPMAAIALEGREFSVLGFIRATVIWQRTPRRFAAAPGTPPALDFHVRERP
jgi:hypothetical protein